MKSGQCKLVALMLFLGAAIVVAVLVGRGSTAGNATTLGGLIMGVASVPIVLAAIWAASLGAIHLLPMRWWISLLAVTCLAAFAAALCGLLPDPAMPNDRSPWWLGAAAAFLTMVALLCWAETCRRGDLAAARLQKATEIAAWIQEPTTLQGALERFDERDRMKAHAMDPLQSPLGRLVGRGLSLVTGLWVFSVYWRFCPPLPPREQFQRWYSQMAQQGDELWWYDSGAESWARYAGECGYAIRRDGTVVDSWMLTTN